MTIESDLDTIHDNHEQADIALKYRQTFEDVYRRLKNLDAEIELISQDVKFDAIPATIKQALNQYWQYIKQFIAAVEASADLLELINWGDDEPI